MAYGCSRPSGASPPATGPPPLRLCLRAIGLIFIAVAGADHVLVPDHAAAADWPGERARILALIASQRPDRNRGRYGMSIQMASNPKIIVVGGGLAGLSAVIKIAEMGGNVDLFSIVPVKRSHSVCAQGGINAAKNLKGEGDSTWQHFDDTIYGGDFLANQPPVKAHVRCGPGHHRPARPHGRAVQPHSRRAARFPPLRRHPVQPHRVRRRDHGPAAALRARRAGAALRSGRQGQEVRSLGISLRRARRATASAAASAPWICAPWRCAPSRPTPSSSPPAASARSSASRPTPWSAPARRSRRSTSRERSTPTASSFRCIPPRIPGEDKLRLMSESARGEGGRVWVPKTPGDKRDPQVDSGRRALVLPRGVVSQIRQPGAARRRHPRHSQGRVRAQPRHRRQADGLSRPHAHRPQDPRPQARRHSRNLRKVRRRRSPRHAR